MKRVLQVFFLMILVVSAHLVQAQDQYVSGTVTASDRSPLPGVNVLLQGTTTGVVTDIEGNYRIRVPEGGGTLMYSFIGYLDREIAIGGQSVINVTMQEDIRQLSEVVVTAAGIERERRALGYGVEEVSSDQIAQKSEPDVLRAMQGKVPGVNITGSTGVPGSATRITIRGNSSFLGNNEPLFIVDGIPYNNQQFTTSNQLTGGAAYSNGLATLDPNNIQSMTVLKGAAAAAIYGSRAANGVIVITTKSGSGKVSKKGLEVAYTSSYAIEQIANLPNYQNKYGAGTEFQYQNANGSWGAAFDRIDSIPTWPAYLTVFPDLGANQPYVAQPDNVKNLFQTGGMFENSISISSGNENSVFTAVVSRMDQEGFIPFTSFERTNLNIGGTSRLSNGLIVGGNFGYTKTLQDGPLFGENQSSDPGAASSFARTLFLARSWNTDLPYTNPATGGPVFFVGNQADHPMWSWENNGLISDVDRTVVNLNLGYDIFDWLNINYKVGVNTLVDRRQQIYAVGSRAYGSNGAIIDDDIYFQEIETYLTATATKNINEDISLRAVLGHNINQQTTDRQSYLGQGIVARGIYDLDNTNSVVPNGGTYSRRRLHGIFADVSLGYKDFLFLNLTGRNDWSSTLPVENQSFFYPAVSSSFVFTEGLNMNSNILTMGKIRASFARVGSDAPVYSLTQLFNVNLGNNSGLIGATPNTDLPFLGQPGITASNVAFDPDLTPEFTKEFELGTELEFFNGRIGVDLTVYDRRTTDQIANVTLPSATGFEQLVTNFGELSNKGIEVGLDLTPVRMANGFSWNIFTAFTRNQSKVESLTDGIERINVRNLFGGGVTPVLEVGQPYGIFYGEVNARDDEGNLLIDPTSGVMFPKLAPEKIGDPNPDFILGVSNTLSYKGFQLSAVLDYRHGGDLYSTTMQAYLGRGVTKDTEDREASRIIPGFLGDPNTGLPLLDEAGNKIPNTVQVTENELWFSGGGTITSFAINGADEWSVWDATVIRLREISLGYNLSPALLSKTPFGSASLTFTGRNLWYNAPNLPKHANFDPEVNGFGSTNTQGIEFASAPSVKRYGVNLRLTF